MGYIPSYFIRKGHPEDIKKAEKEIRKGFKMIMFAFWSLIAFIIAGTVIVMIFERNNPHW
jgi:hypothetical protein